MQDDNINNTTTSSPSSLKHILKSTLCCFHHHDHHILNSPSSYEDNSIITTTQPTKSKLHRSRSSSLCFKSPTKVHDHESHHHHHHHHGDVVKEKCRNLVSRLGRHGHGHGYHRRRHASADFRYDALSYALNFDEGSSTSFDMDGGNNLDELPLRSFTSRLPATPQPHGVAVNTSERVVALS